MSKEKVYQDFHHAVTAYAEENKYDPTDPAMRELCMRIVVGLIGDQSIRLLHDDHETTLEAGEKVLARRDRFYESLAQYPDRLLAKTDSVHIAGGVLFPAVFGNEGHPLWKQVLQVAGEKQAIHFVHRQFNLEELRLVGGLARQLQSDGKITTCIDDRLWYSNGEFTRLVHCDCGACKGLEKSLGGVDTPIEDQLHQEFGQGLPKRPIQPGMDNHRSTTIMVDMGEQTRTLNPLARLQARDSAGLPFHVSFPVRAMENFIRTNNLNDTQAMLLVNAWNDINTGVARAIIGGHNRDKVHANRTRLVINTNGVEGSTLASYVFSQIQTVQHADEMIIQ